MNRHSLRPARKTARAGFTLVELLAVMMVISILAALLVPAVMRSFVTVRNGGVVAEISQLSAAIGKFRATYGMDPPSSIILYEAGGGAASAGGAWDATNMATIRQLWPQFDFVTPIDINGNGTIDTTPIVLAGPECLVFFLGGPNQNGNVPGTAPSAMGACSGFSKNPVYPFVSSTMTALYSTNRDKSGYDFQAGRFVDVDGDGFPEYVDPLPGQTSPYLYYSSYDGQGYNSSAAFATLATNNEFAYVSATYGGLTSSVYLQSTNGTTSTAWNPNSFQIISPGYDRQYGQGGVFQTTGSNRLPGAGRNVESDNISNFSGGVMQP